MMLEDVLHDSHVDAHRPMIAERRPVGKRPHRHPLDRPAMRNETVVQVKGTVLLPQEIVRRIWLSAKGPIAMICADQSGGGEPLEAMRPFDARARLVEIDVPIEVACEHSRSADALVRDEAVEQRSPIGRRGPGPHTEEREREWAFDSDRIDAGNLATAPERTDGPGLARVHGDA